MTTSSNASEGKEQEDKSSVEAPTEEQTPLSRDAAYWAKNVSTLSVGEVPPEAINRNVTGRRVMSPLQGFGKMWQKTYRVRIPPGKVTPTEVIKTWKAHFPEFWPKGNFFYGPLTGIAPGDVALLNLSMPGRVKLSTGVLVLYADDESFTLMTPQGHMFAGWITMSSFEDELGTVVQAQVLMRANDPLYEVALGLGGHRQEDKFWQQTLRSLAARFDAHDLPVDTQVTCVDKKRQWSKAKNVWHNSAIRSGMYMAGAPVRAVARPFKRSSATAAAAERGDGEKPSS